MSRSINARLIERDQPYKYRIVMSDGRIDASAGAYDRLYVWNVDLGI